MGKLIKALSSILILGAIHTQASTTWDQKENAVTAVINWCLVEEPDGSCREVTGAQNKIPKIDSATNVFVSVHNFNYIGYELELNVEKSEIEVYSYLAGLWDQLLNFDFTSQLGISAGSDWWKEIREKKNQLKILLDKYTQSPALNEEQYSKLEDLIKDLKAASAELEVLRLEAYEEADSIVKIQKFDIVDEAHQAYKAANQALISGAEKSLRGKTYRIGNFKAGTTVAVNITSNPISQSSKVSKKAASFDYLSESTFPLVFHVGLTRSQLNDTEFATVRSLGDRDLFVKVKDEDGTENFSAYLSYPLFSKSKNKASFYGTIGTDFSDIGDNIYLGLSARKQKVFLTVGGVYGNVTEGENPMEETGSTSRTVYELIKEDRDWDIFVSLSVKVY